MDIIPDGITVWRDDVPVPGVQRCTVDRAAVIRALHDFASVDLLSAVGDYPFTVTADAWVKPIAIASSHVEPLPCGKART